MFLQENSVIIVMCFISIFTLITGFWFYFKPPKKINMFFGYRTKNSMKSNKHWDYAHYISGKLFIYYGVVLLLAAFVFNFFELNNDNFIMIPLFIIGVILIIVKTERSINKKFKD